MVFICRFSNSFAVCFSRFSNNVYYEIVTELFSGYRILHLWERVWEYRDNVLLL